jgi:hypothetical protein
MREMDPEDPDSQLAGPWQTADVLLREEPREDDDEEEDEEKDDDDKDDNDEDGDDGYSE